MPVRLRPDATYLVTGGLGALGVLTATALARSGARHLLLLGRRGLDDAGPGAIAAVDGLRASGTSVTILAADVGSTTIGAALDATLRDRPPLAGVIHAAGLLGDAALLQQSAEAFARVFGPKVSGAWNLHLYTKDLPLDFFICYSSAAAMIGSPGQANYAAANGFLDGLAAHRRACGLPALSINWGPWESGGMAANERTRARLAARGLVAMSDEDGVSVLERLLGATPAAGIGVIAADWNVFARQFTAGAPPLFDLLVDRAAPARQAADPAPRLGGDRSSALRDLVRTELASVLGFVDASAIGLHDRFFEIGMDSLTALEFRNRLNGRLGLPLPATLAFDFGSIALLVEHLRALLAPAPVADAAAPSSPAAERIDALSDDEVAAALVRELDGDPA